MATRLFVVEETFSFTGREGTILVPGFPDHLEVTVGAIIELRRPDGSCLATTIKGIEMCWPNP